MPSNWVTFRDWFCLKVLPLAIGIIATVIQKQAAAIPGLTALISIVQPYIQEAYDTAVAEQDFKMQAILLAVLSKLFLMELVTPGVEVLSPEDANAILVGLSKDAMEDTNKEDVNEAWRNSQSPIDSP